MIGVTGMSLFRSRRSLKPTAMDPARDVSRELLLEILADAHRAPTHGLTQPWRFQVFTGPSRNRLAEALPALYDQITPEAARQADKRAKLGSAPRLAPVSIAVAASVEPQGKIPEIEEIAATACAVQNLMLSAHAHGIGSFWSTPPVVMSPEFASWLGLDATHLTLGLVYLGYAQAGLAPAETPRHPLDAHVVFHETCDSR
jgi:nitroreductase